MAKNADQIGVWIATDRVFDNGPDRRCVIGTVRLPNGFMKTFKGYANESELSDGVTYRFFGHNRTHPKFGEQFNFNSFVAEDPIDEDSVIAYLETCRKPERGSITKRVALALFEAFGVAAIDRLKADPVGVSQSIKQWDAAKASLAAEYLTSQSGTQRSKLALIMLLNGRGFPKKTIDRAIKEWGAKAADIVRDNPCALMDLPGIGFKGADKLYCDLAREKATTDQEYQEALAAIHRQGLCAAYSVQCESRSSGSTWLPIGFAKSMVQRTVGGTRAEPERAIDWAVAEGHLTVKDNHVAVSRMALHELEIAEFVTGSEPGQDWPSIELIESMAPEGKPLSDHQTGHIMVALVDRLCCLQGSPGVGKTFAVACIVKALISRFGRDAIAVAAPTGKAAVRVGQSMAANGVDLQASTIHRLLQVEGEGSGGWSFHFNEQNPLPYRFIVVDESSMIDVDLMASLLRACTPTTHILFVGDIHQLAPVGHGRPFYDLQKCIPTGHLAEIRRNSGRIVQSCAEIRDRQTITFSPKLDIAAGENLPLIQVAENDQVQAMENLIGQLQSQTTDLIEEVQILTGKNDGSAVARKPLNTLLQKILNPNGESIQGNPFRRGDKIVCLKNGKYQDFETNLEEHFVANGELGRVMNIMPGRMIVRLCDPVRTILITHAPVQDNEKEVADSEDVQRGAVGDWDLGYCLSVHRSQGSQWRFVIVQIDKAGAMVQSRNWVYTAISRAEVATFCIGAKPVVLQSLKRDGISDRKTFLVERIKSQQLAAKVDFQQLFAEV